MSNPTDPTPPRDDLVPADKVEATTIEVTVARAMEKAAGAGVARTFVYALSAILAAHPAIGPYAALVSVADVFVTGGAQRVAEVRAKKFAESVAAEFVAVRAEMIRADYFETEGGVDMLMRALASATRVSDDARRNAIARILVAAASGNVPPAAEPESLVTVLGEMSEGEAAVLGSVWWRYGAHGERMPPFDRLEGFAPPTAPNRDGAFLIRRLASRGLLVERLSYELTEDGDEDFRHISPSTEFTPTGKALMHFLGVVPPTPE